MLHAPSEVPRAEMYVTRDFSRCRKCTDSRMSRGELKRGGKVELGKVVDIVEEAKEGSSKLETFSAHTPFLKRRRNVTIVYINEKIPFYNFYL